MAQVIKKETLELLLLRGGVTSEVNSHSVREDTKNRDIRGNKLNHFQIVKDFQSWGINISTIIRRYPFY